MTRNDALLLHNWESCSVHSLSLILNRSIEYLEVRSELGVSRVSAAFYDLRCTATRNNRTRQLEGTFVATRLVVVSAQNDKMK